ncbi:MAG: NAD(P)-dependent glycerol-3-phosphate dehydrogenase [Proteobacteria bacterium]|nr:NAD(P)-dependent glycerol-3-phosphate dehydrogenase [Pseudomonadota bacterium]
MAIAAVLGAGSWGTALALQLSRNRHSVQIWDCDTDLIDTLQTRNCNLRYLPDHPLPDSLSAHHDLADALAHADFVLVAAPSYAMRSVCDQLVELRFPEKLAWATKGFEKASGLMMHEVVAQVLGDKIKKAVLSGPSFAGEVASQLPAAVTLASDEPDCAEELAGYFHSSSFRVYTSGDVIGVELGGTIKNVLAIAAGIADGFGFGANARAALVTRGLAEMMRLGQKLGAERTTLMGLAGVGDLVLTCTDDQSRNRRLGLALAHGKTAQQYMEELGQAVEGFHAAQVVHRIAQDHQVDMPICTQVWRVLNGDAVLETAVSELLSRDMKVELA